jgi:hypothetical protein
LLAALALGSLRDEPGSLGLQGARGERLALGPPKAEEGEELRGDETDGDGEDASDQPLPPED